MASDTLRLHERVLVRLDELPFAVLLRMALGYLVVAVWHPLLGDRWPWTLFPFFLIFLVAFRVGMMVVRRIFRVSPAAGAIWLERRQLAKRSDSYQWQKLLWMGLGMLVYTARVEQRSAVLVALTVFCIVSGAIGLAIWLRSKATAPQRA